MSVFRWALPRPGSINAPRLITSKNAVSIVDSMYFAGEPAGTSVGLSGSTEAISNVSVNDIFGNAIPVNGNTPDVDPVNLGTKFRASSDGFVNSVRFYNANVGILFTGQLYTGAGVLLATGTTVSTNAGWQTVVFDTPVVITANTTYVASYYNNNAGGYAAIASAFTSSSIVNGQLTALQSGIDGPNGVFTYNATSPQFPVSSFNANNYYVDVGFTNANVTSFVPTILIGLSGQSISDSTGNVTPSSDVNVALTGQQESFSAGILKAVFNVNLTGSTESDFTGSVVPSSATLIALVGQSITEVAGSLRPVITLSLTGSLETDQLGSVTPSSAINVALTGQQESVSSGNLAPVFSVPFTGQFESDFTSNVTPSNATLVALSGSQFTFSTGLLKAAFNKPLTGLLETEQTGNVTPTSGTVITPNIPLGGGGSGGKNARRVVQRIDKISHRTYAERKEVEDKVFNVLFNIVEDVAEDNNIAKAVVTDSLVSSIATDIYNKTDYVNVSSMFSKAYLEEIARLQTNLILLKLRQAQELDDEQALMLLL